MIFYVTKVGFQTLFFSEIKLVVLFMNVKVEEAYRIMIEVKDNADIIPRDELPPPQLRFSVIINAFDDECPVW